MQGNRRYSFGATPQPLSAEPTRRSQPPPSQTPRQRRASLGSAPGSHRSEATPRRHGSVASHRPSRQSRDLTTFVGAAPPRRATPHHDRRCRHCSHPLRPTDADADHDRYCPLRPYPCRLTDPTTGAVCGRLCRGLEMRASHEAKCRHALSGSGRVPSPAARPLACLACGAAGFSGQGELARHMDVCGEVIVSCPLLCELTMRRGEVAQHVIEKALQHDPLRIPNSTDYAADDIRVVLALVMNLLLEQAGVKEKNNDNTITSTTGPYPPPLLPINNKKNNSKNIEYSSSPTSRQSSVHSTPAVIAPIIRKTISITTTTTSPVAVIAKRRRENISPSMGSTCTGIAPEPRSNIPEPILRNDNNNNNNNNSYPLTNEYNGINQDFKTISQPKCIPLVQNSSKRAGYVISTTVSREIRPSKGKRQQQHHQREEEIEEEEEVISSVMDELHTDELLRRLEIQRVDVDKLKEFYYSKNLRNLNKNEKLQLAEEMRNSVRSIDVLNNDIHMQALGLVDQTRNTSPSLMKVLENWKSLDRHWYDIKLALYDYVMSHHS